MHVFDLEKVGQGQRSCDNWICHPHKHICRTQNHVPIMNSFKDIGTFRLVLKKKKKKNNNKIISRPSDRWSRVKIISLYIISFQFLQICIWLIIEFEYGYI